MDKDFLDQIFDVDCNGKVEDVDFIIDSQMQKQLESPKFYDEDDEDDEDREYDFFNTNDIDDEEEDGYWKDDSFEDDDDEDDDDEYISNDTEGEENVNTITVTLKFGPEISAEAEALIEKLKAASLLSEGIRERKIEAVQDFDVLYRKKELDDWEKMKLARAQFVISGSENTAANYLSVFSGFEIAEAVINEYGLPEDFYADYGKSDNIHILLEYLRDYDGKLAFDVWRWVMDKFAGYAKYDESAICGLAACIFASEYDGGEWYEYNTACIEFFADHKDLLRKVVSFLGEEDDAAIWSGLAVASKLNHQDVAETYIDVYIKNKHIKPVAKAGTLGLFIDAISHGENYAKNKKWFNNYFVPKIQSVNNSVFNKHLPEWRSSF